MFNFRVVSSLLFLFTLTVTGCGGGSSDGDAFVGAGRLQLRVDPREIDTGNRLQVIATIDDAHPDGVLLKFRIPKALSYVSETSKLIVDGKDSPSEPRFNLESDETYFLVYFFSQEDFGLDNSGEVRFELRGDRLLNRGVIQVDLDVNDPLVKDSDEFDVDSPEFSAVVEREVTVFE